MVELILALTRTADWRMGTVPHLVSTLGMTLLMEAQVSWARGSERISAPTLALTPWSGKGKEISPHFPCQLHQAGGGKLHQGYDKNRAGPTPHRVPRSRERVPILPWAKL